MSFVLRAALVIGVLSYVAAQREQAGPRHAASPARATPAEIGVPASFPALPAEARERIAREGAAEIARRLAPMPPSEDTLADGDRRPAWRGVAGR